MLDALEPLRQFVFPSILLRLCLSMIFGGIIGLEGDRKGRPAGFRTYMLVCLGATLTMLLGQYEAIMLRTHWAEQYSGTTAQIDVARFGAQVINGIGFLGAGTIMVTGKQQIKGLTTAAGLWACTCVGLAIGAGFYEAVILAFGLVFLVVKVFPYLEDAIVHNIRNINVYIEFDRVEHVGMILHQIRSLDARIYEVEVNRREGEPYRNPSAVFIVRLNKKMPHAHVLAHISKLECISAIEEV